MHNNPLNFEMDRQGSRLRNLREYTVSIILIISESSVGGEVTGDLCCVRSITYSVNYFDLS